MGHMPSENKTNYLLDRGTNTTYRVGASGLETFVTVTNTLKSYEVISRVSNRTPGFHNPKTPRPLMHNAFAYSRSLETGLTGYHVKTEGGFPAPGGVRTEAVGLGAQSWLSIGWTTLYINPLSGSEMAAVDAVARNKLLAKIKAQKINLAQAFAERRKTAQLIGDSAIRIASSMVALKRGDILGAAGHLGVSVGKRARKRIARKYVNSPYGRIWDQQKALANGWLELQYGWKPLLTDIYGAAEQLAYQAGRKDFATVHASHVLTVPLDRVFNLPSYPQYFEKGSQSGTLRYEVSYHLCYVGQNSAGHTMAALGLTNPALLMWELLPFSFVVDWFLTVGNALEVLDAANGIKFMTGSRTIFQSYEGSATVVRIGKPPYHYDGAGSINMSGTKVNRNPISEIPSPALPQFKNPFGYIHLANALALLTTVMGRKKAALTSFKE